MTNVECRNDRWAYSSVVEYIENTLTFRLNAYTMMSLSECVCSTYYVRANVTLNAKRVWIRATVTWAWVIVNASESDCERLRMSMHARVFVCVVEFTIEMNINLCAQLNGALVAVTCCMFCFCVLLNLEVWQIYCCCFFYSLNKLFKFRLF